MACSRPWERPPAATPRVKAAIKSARTVGQVAAEPLPGDPSSNLRLPMSGNALRAQPDLLDWPGRSAQVGFLDLAPALGTLRLRPTSDRSAFHGIPPSPGRCPDVDHLSPAFA